MHKIGLKPAAMRNAFRCLPKPDSLWCRKVEAAATGAINRQCKSCLVRSIAREGPAAHAALLAEIAAVLGRSAIFNRMLHPPIL